MKMEYNMENDFRSNNQQQMESLGEYALDRRHLEKQFFHELLLYP